MRSHTVQYIALQAPFYLLETPSSPKVRPAPAPRHRRRRTPSPLCYLTVERGILSLPGSHFG